MDSLTSLSMVNSELAPDERLLWVGNPDPKRLMMAGLPIVLFAIPWTIFSIFWEVMALTMTSGAKSPPGFKYIFPLFGLPFIAIGFGMLSSPYWTYKSASKIFYVVTTKRLLVIKGGKGKSVVSYPPQNITFLERSERNNGTGDILFSQSLSVNYRSILTTQTNTPSKVGFIGIKEVRKVEQIIRENLLDPKP